MLEVVVFVALQLNPFSWSKKASLSDSSYKGNRARPISSAALHFSFSDNVKLRFSEWRVSVQKSAPLPEMGFEGKNFASNQTHTSSWELWCGLLWARVVWALLWGFLGEHYFIEFIDSERGFGWKGHQGVMGMQTWAAEGWEGLLFSWGLGGTGVGKQKEGWGGSSHGLAACSVLQPCLPQLSRGLSSITFPCALK